MRSMKTFFVLLFLLCASVSFAAFPTVVSVTESTATDVAAFPVTMPATVNANELLLIIEAHWNDQVDAVAAPSGWTMIAGDFDGDNDEINIFAKKAIGNEDGTTVTINYNDNHINSSAHTYRIQGWDGGTLTSVVEAVI